MKKAKKRLIITSLLITILIISFLLSGCSNVSKYAKSKSEKASGESAVVDYTCVSKPKSEKKIYVILKNYHGDYWKTVIEGIERAAKEIDAVKEGADGILLAPANSNSLVDSCEKVRKKKIPVVLIDSSINSTEFDVCYMTDNIDAGEMAAQEMLTMLHDAGNSPQEPLAVGILLSSDASQAMVNRVSGFLDYWAKYAPTKWEITKDIALNGGDVEKAESDAAKLLKKNENIKGIYGCNNTSTVGIAKTLTKQKRTDIVMVGFDMAEETKQFIKDPDYRGVSLMQKQDQMGYLGIGTLNSLINGKKSEQKYFDTGVIMIDSDYLMEKGVS